MCDEITTRVIGQQVSVPELCHLTVVLEKSQGLVKSKRFFVVRDAVEKYLIADLPSSARHD